MKKVAVFCGSRTGHDPKYMEAAKQLGKKLAEAKIDLVYGGSMVGCMGAVADAVMEGGGEVIGVIPKKLAKIEVAHQNLTKLHIVETMHERKAMMADLADGFIALPGGSGTMEEWFEVLTWAQIGYHKKPCSLLNINDYYTPLISFFDHMIEQGFVNKEHKQLIIVENEIDKLINILKQF
ncbi:Rossman fold protein, TIGR00730 family [Anaerobacillus alkalilacustris]|uniref:Cytokinin riboside 5'-monophosphate phosphoribohydrolase n=1 Tax=Anaerobacillus alkalilacustris TaxID=393763 RepID=A0A1S2LJ40_9BACI|nr:TIGR00730 family Rossman fold protein [Anaerobacillus alkalilacustris]OIJ12522.1 Rossman fold protein, TIGR00730 family [Anaerobacillus alkalilacustris]